MPDRRCDRDDQSTQPGSIVHISKSKTALIAPLLLSAADLVAAEAPFFYRFEWPLLAESGPSFSSNFGDLNVRFRQKRTFG